MQLKEKNKNILEILKFNSIKKQDIINLIISFALEEDKKIKQNNEFYKKFKTDHLNGNDINNSNILEYNNKLLLINSYTNINRYKNLNFYINNTPKIMKNLKYNYFYSNFMKKIKDKKSKNKNKDNLLKLKYKKLTKEFKCQLKNI